MNPVSPRSSPPVAEPAAGRAFMDWLWRCARGLQAGARSAGDPARFEGWLDDLRLQRQGPVAIFRALALHSLASVHAGRVPARDVEGFLQAAARAYGASAAQVLLSELEESFPAPSWSARDADREPLPDYDHEPLEIGEHCFA